MALGMTYEQYWYGDSWITKYFFDAYQENMKIKNKQAWLQGMYFYDGLSCVLSNMFGKKGSNKAKYPTEPYKLYEDKNEENVSLKTKIKENELLKAKLFFSNWAKSVNDKFNN